MTTILQRHACNAQRVRSYLRVQLVLVRASIAQLVVLITIAMRERLVSFVQPVNTSQWVHLVSALRHHTRVQRAILMSIIVLLPPVYYVPQEFMSL